jgi:hypothetical protein
MTSELLSVFIDKVMHGVTIVSIVWLSYSYNQLTSVVDIIGRHEQKAEDNQSR